METVGVSSRGVVTCFNTGSANITVNDVRNSDHYDIAKVQISNSR